MNHEVLVKLDNIGIIQDSEIKLNGLTIITGHNNSGKTTVGKTMYAILSAVENIEREANADKCSFAESELLKIVNKFKDREYYVPKFWFDNTVQLSEIEREDYLYAFFNKRIDFQFGTTQNAIDYIECLKKLAEELSDRELDKILNNLDENSKVKTRVNKRKQLIRAFEKIIVSLNYDSELINYANKKIINSLQQEFNYQILPVRKVNPKGKIEYWDNGKSSFNIDILKNELENPEDKTYNSKSFYDVTFVDDVFTLDRMYSARNENDKNSLMYKSLFLFQQEKQTWNDYSECKSHQEDLLFKLTKKNNNLFEEIINEKEANELFDKINEVFPDEIVLGDNGYICSESKLDIKNLAAGSKMFAIIKKLIENAFVQEENLLILDEPESHLHPEWQNKFAEIIVLLIRCIGPHVLLTTHSPNFLMALELYSKKYGIWDKNVNIYCTEHVNDDYMVQYVDVKANIDKAYAKLANPLFELKRMKINEIDD